MIINGRVLKCSVRKKEVKGSDRFGFEFALNRGYRESGSGSKLQCRLVTGHRTGGW